MHPWRDGAPCHTRKTGKICPCETTHSVTQNSFKARWNDWLRTTCKPSLERDLRCKKKTLRVTRKPYSCFRDAHLVRNGVVELVPVGILRLVPLVCHQIPVPLGFPHQYFCTCPLPKPRSSALPEELQIPFKVVSGSTAPTLRGCHGGKERMTAQRRCVISSLSPVVWNH